MHNTGSTKISTDGLGLKGMVAKGKVGLEQWTKFSCGTLIAALHFAVNMKIQKRQVLTLFEVGVITTVN